MTTLAPTIGPAGISAPSYAVVLAGLQSIYQGIYGSDVYLGNDSQDGQFIAAIAQAISDCNAACVAVFNSFSPTNAQGTGLSSLVKINGLQRLVATYSTVQLLIVGQAGTVITNGIAGDGTYQWALPAIVTIPPAGDITVTATCTTQGAIAAAAGAVDQIGTPTAGWQSVTNPSAASAGAPIELDPALQARQSNSTALPSRTVLEGIIGAVLNIPGVTQVNADENDTSTTDTNGVPPKNISLVVAGGDSTAIAQAIAAKKTPGGGTYGTTTVTVPDIYGIQHNINFFRPTAVPVTAAISIKALTGYTSNTGAAIQSAVANYVNAVAIGGGESAAVEWADALAAARGVSGASTFKIVSLALTGPGGAGTPDIPLLFNQQATCSVAGVTLSVG